MALIVIVILRPDRVEDIIGDRDYNFYAKFEAKVVQNSFRREGRRKMIIACITLIFVIIIIYIYCGNTSIGITRIIIKNECIPTSFDGYKIAQISDLHNTEFGENQEKLIEKLKQVEPDIIVVTGDLLDSRRTNIAVALSTMRQAVSLAPIYYVTGNHESRIPKKFGMLENEMEEIGVHILRNESESIEIGGESIQIIGLDDLAFQVPESITSKRKYITKDILEELVIEDKYTLVLSHRPELFYEYCSSEVDLVFCGHAHGGQFRIPFIGGVLAPNQGFWPKWSEGCIEKGTTKMVVSRGLGNSVFPYRINNPPELVMVTLKSETGKTV